jgi:hypothetical protein
MRKAADQVFCSDRCRDYVPPPPRAVDAEWFIVAGPVDFCVECGLAIMPRKPHGYITPFRHEDGLHCLECHDAGELCQIHFRLNRGRRGRARPGVPGVVPDAIATVSNGKCS